MSSRIGWTARRSPTLRTVADRIEAGNDIGIEGGGDSVSQFACRPFEVKAERETPSGSGAGELSVAFELEWDEGEEDDDGGLSIG